MRVSTENSPSGKGSTQGICAVNYGRYGVFADRVDPPAVGRMWRSRIVRMMELALDARGGAVPEAQVRWLGA